MVSTRRRPQASAFRMSRKAKTVPTLMTEIITPAASMDRPSSSRISGRIWLSAMKSKPSKKVATLRKASRRH
jgi:hypothetical protein